MIEVTPECELSPDDIRRLRRCEGDLLHSVWNLAGSELASGAGCADTLSALHTVPAGPAKSDTITRLVRDPVYVPYESREL
uniref:hypothetical protein n=1 Tax=Nocardia brasiliensis TaxID=37326 RepID=UPI00245733B7